MRAGRLRHTIELMCLQTNQNEFGEEVGVYTPIAKVRADATPLPSRPFIESSAEQNEATTRFTIRHRGDIKKDWQVRWDGEQYELTSVQHTKARKRQTVLLGRVVS